MLDYRYPTHFSKYTKPPIIPGCISQYTIQVFRTISSFIGFDKLVCPIYFRCNLYVFSKNQKLKRLQN